MLTAAVIFDVDGPLLELTEAEEDLYFAPLERRYGLTDLPRDWDSYPIRNDLEIYREILDDHLGAPPSIDALEVVVGEYLAALEAGYASGTLQTISIPGARTILERLSGIEGLALGIATANFGAAARLRLEQTGLWKYVRDFSGGAEAGGTKSEILQSVLVDLALPVDRVVFLGDNLNDLRAGTDNGVHFIGFDTDKTRRQILSDAGAETVCGNHETAWRCILEKLSFI